MPHSQRVLERRNAGLRPRRSPLFRFGLKRLINAQPDSSFAGGAECRRGLDEALKLNPISSQWTFHSTKAERIEFVKNIGRTGKCRIWCSRCTTSRFTRCGPCAQCPGYLMKEEVLRGCRGHSQVAGGDFLSESLRQQVLTNCKRNTPINHPSIHSRPRTRGAATKRKRADAPGNREPTEHQRQDRGNPSHAVREKMNFRAAPNGRFAIAWTGESQG